MTVCYILKQVLELLQQHQLYLKISKFIFAYSHMEYLGHVITIDGVQMDFSKVESIVN